MTSAPARWIAPASVARIRRSSSALWSCRSLTDRAGEELAGADGERNIVDGDDCPNRLVTPQRDRARGRVVLVLPPLPWSKPGEW